MSYHDWTVLKYYAYNATTSNGFYVPYAYIYLLQRGYGLEIFGLANAVFLVVMVGIEVPAGYFGDWFGRRSSLAMGNLIGTVVMGLYPFIDSPEGYVALFGLWGAGWAFSSATGDAWLYDLLDESSDSERFAHLSGRSRTARLLVSAISALLAAPLYWINPALPFLANAILQFAGIPVLASLPAAQSEFDTITVHTALRALRRQVTRPEVRWLIIYVALFNLLFSMTRWLEQPALAAIGFPISGFGLLYAIFQIVSGAATTTTGWIQDHMGPRTFFALLAPIVGFGYALIGIFPIFIIPVLFLRRTIMRVITPIRNQYLNDRLEATGRATVLSGVSMVLSLSSALANTIAGRFAQQIGPITFLPIAGIVVASMALVVWVGSSPIRPTTIEKTQQSSGIPTE